MGKLQAGIIPVTPFQQNCTILFDEETKQGVVVDPGGDVPTILKVVEENGIALEGNMADPRAYRPRRRCR